MKQLIHNGVLVPKYEWKKLHINVKDREAELTPKQEEMAVAWVKKLGTPYVEDVLFAKNFFKEFCKALGITGTLSPEDFDFSEVREYVEKEKAQKLSLSREERKQLAAQRKAQREANKEKYGYAIIDGVRTEISNYVAEPSCIFMGRGKHPLRGRWKAGPSEEEIELNLQPEAPRPPGNWKGIVWQPDAIWIARWKDSLSDKIKYVWLSETSILKQKKDIEKFDKARELRQNLTRIQRHILENLDAVDLRRRKTATVCFLINRLKIRVGDEKDPDEADTVGASTLRTEHIRFGEGGRITFNFLGKDSVPHTFNVELPEKVVRNLKEFSTNPKSNLFNGVDSQRVSEFLDEVISGLSAKVFRTYYASSAVENKLDSTSLKAEAPPYEKAHVATLANLEAAKMCNHKRTIPKTWEISLQKKETRLKERTKKAKETQEKLKLMAKKKEELYASRLKKKEEQLNELGAKLEAIKQQIDERKQQGKTTAALERRASLTRKAIARQRQQIKKIKGDYAAQSEKLRERIEKTRQHDRTSIEQMRLQIEAKRQTRDYNLTTSLKSYIDPRVYYNWGRKVDYDWKLYYPKTLQKKFSWVETTTGQSS